jgi:predicted nucleic acid-binding protein
MALAAIVVDTNIIVSALLTRNGNPAKVFELIGSCITPLYTEDIMKEYQRVRNARPTGFSPAPSIPCRRRLPLRP